ncbi:MAG: PglZ domain-containing protein [Massilibacteroides sp.]|jgi:hypothetical protein|nr:PglZ domain-containing protein [Massilibacteroides sp.]
MDIQGYIIDKWLGTMNANHPILTVYDTDGKYYSLLPLVAERGVKVIDTTKNLLANREEACDYWINTLVNDSNARMLIYRTMKVAENKKVNDPYIAFTQVGKFFPFGPNDNYVNMCKNFLPGKEAAIDDLFKNGTDSFNNINALQEGVSYPELENLTKGKSFVEITLGMLTLMETANTAWMSEWKSFGERYLPGLDCNGTTLRDIKQKLWQYLLFSEFVLDLPGDLPSELKTVACCPKEQYDNIIILCKNLRNKNDLRDDYVEQAQTITAKLHLDTLFATAKNLGKIVTFAFENRVEYNIYLDDLHNGEYEKASLLLNKNKQSVWYQADAEVSLFWDLAEQCERMLGCIRKSNVELNNLKELTAWYAEQGYQVDAAFRKYQHKISTSDEDNASIAELSKFVYAQYRSFTEQIQQKYQKDIMEEGYPIPSIESNISFWQTHVEPLLNQNKRVVVLFADAFRYEMGKDLSVSLGNSYTVDCQPSAAYIPTVTRFGMSALLPHANDKLELKVDDKKLMPFIDGKKVETPSDRINHIKENIPSHIVVADITSDKFLAANVDSSTNLMIIRSTKIDSAGENITNIGLSEMDSELKNFSKSIRKCKTLGFDTFFIVADHGFMIQPGFQAGDNMSKPVGTVVLEERRCLGGDLNSNETSWMCEPSKFGIKTDVFRFAFAKQYGVYEKNIIYFHEGLSLQENIVPILKVTLNEDKQQDSFALDLTYKGKKDGVVRIERPLIEICLRGIDTLFMPEKCILRIMILNEHNKEVGHVVGSTFYDETTELITIPGGCEKVKQPIELDQGLQGDIIVSALDPDTNATMATLRLQTELDF